MKVGMQWCNADHLGAIGLEAGVWGAITDSSAATHSTTYTIVVLKA